MTRSEGSRPRSHDGATLTWSPDGRTLAFTAEARLQSIPADGGPTFVISHVPASGTEVGVAWLPNGNIVFGLVDPATEVDFHYLSALPDNRLIVATHKRKEDSDVIELVDGQRRVLLTSDSTVGSFEYMAPGTLLFRRITTNEGIWAVPFREGAMRIPLESTPTIAVGQPTVVVRDRPAGPRISSYDTTHDGEPYPHVETVTASTRSGTAARARAERGRPGSTLTLHRDAVYSRSERAASVANRL